MAGSLPTICCRSTAAGKASRARLRHKADRHARQPRLAKLLRQQPLYQIPSALRRRGRGVPQPDHGGPLPGLRAGDRYARAGRGCERPPGQDGGQVLIRARGLRRGALCRFVHALQSGGPPGMENAGEKAGGRTAAAITAKSCPAAEARLLSDHAGIRIPPPGRAAAHAEAGPARAGLAGAAAALRACACAAELSASEAGSKTGGQTGAEARTED